VFPFRQFAFLSPEIFYDILYATTTPGSIARSRIVAYHDDMTVRMQSLVGQPMASHVPDGATVSMIELMEVMN
jgi:hypothetical protein